MWIRSQDKEKLVKCENVFIVYDNGSYNIKSFVEKYNYFELGSYSTKEKALKVMNMIEREIRLDTCQTRVFQMPQDNEVE